ncbi:MAG: hypothetical protein AAB676_02150 [Verrucomicrobiota bacterium]
MNDETSISFWRWLAKGSGGKPGYRRLIDRWLILHFGIGVLLGFIVRVNLQTAANTVLLPLVGILIGLCFAWAGNAQALLQAGEIEEMTQFHKGGFAEYVFTYQAAILTILVTLVTWALAGFEIFDKAWPSEARQPWYFVVKAILFTLSSLTLRECWHVVLGAQWMLLMQHKIKRSKKGEKE